MLLYNVFFGHGFFTPYFKVLYRFFVFRFRAKIKFWQKLTSATDFFGFVTKLTSATVFLLFVTKTYPSNRFFSFSSAKLASVTAFCLFWSAKLKSDRPLFCFASEKDTSAPIFCRKCFRLRMWANYKTSKNYYAQSHLFPVIKLQIKKRRNNTNKAKTSMSKSIKYNYFLRFKRRVKNNISL